MASGKLVWVDRKGAAKLLGAQPRAYAQPTLSPEGRRVTVASQEANLDVWVYDTGRGGLARLTFQPGEDESPVWTPDGKKVAYSSSLSGKARTILWKNSDGSGTEDPLVASGYHTHLSSFSSDGRFLAYTDYDPITRGDIWVLPLDENATSHSGGGVSGRQPRVFLQTPFNERDAKFSPDGHWIAYSSDESGSDQIYVQAFPGPGGKWQVSADGGYGPTWAANGRELFYRNGDTMMVVSVTTRPSFSAMPPRVLFEGKFEENNRRESNYDVAPDGQHFLMIKASEAETGPTQLHLVVNWFEELKQRAANSTK
jgi:Tol biopolymer transport system component